MVATPLFRRFCFVSLLQLKLTGGFAPHLSLVRSVGYLKRSSSTVVLSNDDGFQDKFTGFGENALFGDTFGQTGQTGEGSGYIQGDGYTEGAGYSTGYPQGTGNGYTEGTGYTEGAGYVEGPAGYVEGTGYTEGSGEYIQGAAGYTGEAGYNQSDGYNQGYGNGLVQLARFGRENRRIWMQDSNNPFVMAINRFNASPRTYLVIPFVAAFVGWLTNWMAVQMIFYPIKFRGFPILRFHEVPLGFLGWQGIVPCKTRPMSEAMVHMVSTQLLSVKEVFSRLNPVKVANLMAPEVPKLTSGVLQDVGVPNWVIGVPGSFFEGLPSDSQFALRGMNVNFIKGLVKGMQRNIDSVFNLRNCVVDQMMQDRSLLGKLFQKCGRKELNFLTNSGLWFGFLLGVIQMIVALFWENPWSLSIGGAVVGYATNWLALKWIFEPVNPTKFGPFVLQGQFLRRQKEVAKEFSHFFATKILNSEQLWNSVLTDPTTSPAFSKLFNLHFGKFLEQVSLGFLRFSPGAGLIGVAARKALHRLPQHIGVVHEYVDKTLNLEESLRISMERMSSAQFERVLHPIFEEDELTLIIAGAALGFVAGLIQQGISTGNINVEPFLRICRPVGRFLRDTIVAPCRSWIALSSFQGDERRNI